MTSAQQEELLTAVHAYLEQRWTPEQKAFLQETIREDADARTMVAEMLSDHSSLYWQSMGDQEDQHLIREVISQECRSRRPSVGSLLALASCLVIGAVLLWQWQREDLPASIALVQNVSIIQQDQRVKVGTSLMVGDSLSITEGLVEISFPESGVYLVGNAPLDFTLLSPDRIYLNEGEIKLHVPPQGIGFVVETKEREITDLGTSFVVKASQLGSRVLVLDGEVSVDEEDGAQDRLMQKGDIAEFPSAGVAKYSQKPQLPEQHLPYLTDKRAGLIGRYYYYPQEGGSLTGQPQEDMIGRDFTKFIESTKKRYSIPAHIYGGRTVLFEGIAGAIGDTSHLIDRNCLKIDENGWMLWYRGIVTVPKTGRYRFWGYGDNNLTVSLDHRLIFNGSRHGSELANGISCYRQNFPSYPCLNAKAGLSCGEWIELTAGAPIRIDILFGESGNVQTSGLLMIEQEGATYETTYWGQPRYPVFLTEPPSPARLQQLRSTRRYLEQNLQGSFSIDPEAVWDYAR